MLAVMLKWIIQHQAEISALSNLAIASLTLVLIVITSVYVRANWKTMRFMEADLRVRTKPLPKIEVHQQIEESGWLKYTLKVTTANAPLRFLALEIEFKEGISTKFPSEPGEIHFHREVMQIQNRVLRVDEAYDHTGEYFPGKKVVGWNATLIYSDLTGLTKYKSSVDSVEPFLGYEEILDQPTSHILFDKEGQKELWKSMKRSRRHR